MVENSEEVHVEPSETEMSHLVMYSADDDANQYILAASLDEAVAHAEYLVNELNNDSTRIFEMREVKLEYRRFYRVQVQSDVGELPSGLGETTAKPQIAAVPV